MSKYDNEIWAYALKNSLEFGSTDAGKILPKLFRHGLEKKDIGKIMPELNKIIEKINSMDNDAKAKEYSRYEKYALERDVKEEGLPELDNVKGKVVTRLAPEPSKYNHIGHALVFLIQYLYAKKYNGECILRADDTNPEKSTMEYYNSMKEDLTWLGIKWDREIIASNDMANYYKYAEYLIKQGYAFTCSCAQEDVKKLREKMQECKCRNKSKDENLKEWQQMLDRKFKEGERTLRLKGDMKSNNGVMRDPIIFRISYVKHFMQGEKYGVWPVYDFENPIADATNGVTHVIRSKEFETRYELHEYLLKLLKLKMPVIREIGRYQITGAETQGRVIRELIEKKKVIGWDDPRLVTVRALRRRGFVPEMFQELAQTVGLSKSGGHIDPTVLAAVNRKIIDPIANRFSFVPNSVEIDIKGKPEVKEIEVQIHPDKKETRKIKVDKIFIGKDDLKSAKGKEIRLLHLFNIKIDKTGKKIEFTSEENKDIPKINWVSNPIETKILMPDGSWSSGMADPGISKLKVGDIIQFERFGFCRLDKINKDSFEFWFTHK